MSSSYYSPAYSSSSVRGHPGPLSPNYMNATSTFPAGGHPYGGHKTVVHTNDTNVNLHRNASWSGNTWRTNPRYATSSGLEMRPRPHESFSLRRNTQRLEQTQPVEVAVDLHLDDANKAGGNYNVSLTLNKATLAGLNRQTISSLNAEEYIAEDLYNGNYQPPRRPPPSISGDSGMLTPGARSKTNITLLEDTPPPTNFSSSNQAAMQFRQRVGEPQWLIVASSRSPSFSEKYEVGSNLVDSPPNVNGHFSPRPQQKPSSSSSGPKFSMSVDQTMTMDYKHGEEYDMPIPVHRASHPHGGYVRSSRREKVETHTRTVTSEFEIHELLRGAPPDSIRQTINVERDGEEVIGPLSVGEGDELLDVETISEKVDIGMKEGTAQVAVKVRCERVVPFHGVNKMFKKSCVNVTRLIEIDLMATGERRRLNDYIKSRSKTMKQTSDGKNRGRKSYQQYLSTKDTFKLYKTFMGMAEADEHSKKRENIRIDRRPEEQKMPEMRVRDELPTLYDYEELEYEYDTDDLEKRLEERMIAYSMRTPEPDTISFMSATSENYQNMLY